MNRELARLEVRSRHTLEQIPDGGQLVAQPRALLGRSVAELSDVPISGWVPVTTATLDPR